MKQIDGDHYKKYPIQLTEFCEVSKIPFNEGTVMKYVLRHRDKNGKAYLLKAISMIQELIKLNYRGPSELIRTDGFPTSFSLHGKLNIDMDSLRS